MSTLLASHKEKFLAFWSLRIGVQAADLRWRWANSLNLAYALNFVSLPCVFAGAWAHIGPLVPAGIVIYVGQGALLVRAIRQLRASNRAASQALGVKIGLGGIPGPPRSADAYEKWRQQHNVSTDGLG